MSKCANVVTTRELTRALVAIKPIETVKERGTRGVEKRLTKGFVGRKIGPDKEWSKA